MNSDIKILIVSEQKNVVNQLMTLLSEYKSVATIEPMDVTKEIDRLAPDLVFLVQQNEDSSVELIQYIHNVNPLTVIIFIAQDQDFGLLRNVTRAGAIDFFVFPDETSLLSSRFQGILNSLEERKKHENEVAATATFKKGRGKIYSFYSARGGSGKTLLASTFAQALKFESTAQVLLIDLNLQYGGVETILSIESSRSLADLKPVIQELNENHILNVSEKEKYSKMDILLSPADAEVAETLSDEFVTKLLRNCRRSYDFVVVDLPSTMNGLTYTALEEADKIYYVLNLDTPSIHLLKKFEELAFRLGIDFEERLELICNQVGRDNEISDKDIEKLVTQNISAKIRRDFKGVQAAINKGEPIRKEATSKKLIPFAKDVRKWALAQLH